MNIPQEGAPRFVVVYQNDTGGWKILGINFVGTTATTQGTKKYM